MSERNPRSFDCVQSMREIRDRISAEIGDMTYEELARWLRDQRYSDPVLRRLADRAAREADRGVIRPQASARTDHDS